MSTPTTDHPSLPAEASAPEPGSKLTTSSAPRSRTRRAVLAGALGGAGVLAAEAIAHVSPVRAANNDPVTVGNSFTGTSPTAITNSTGDGIQGINSSTSQSGVFGFASNSTGTTYGVFARSDSTSGTGAYGWAKATTGTTEGVHGQSDSTSGTGVHGVATASSGATKGVVGVANASSSSIGVDGESTNGTGVYGNSSSYIGVYGSCISGIGVFGTSTSSIGVDGASSASNAAGVLGHSFGDSTGVEGYSGTGSAPASKPKTGVYGYASQDASSKGVWGFSGRGVGVYGQANKAGFAIRSHGRVMHDQVSGVAGIPAGATSVTLTPGVTITGNSFVLLTPRANIGSRGLWYTTDHKAGTITIHISSTRSSTTKIAWLLLG